MILKNLTNTIKYKTMKRVINKYILADTGEQVVYMGNGAKPISVAEQRGQLVIWAEDNMHPTDKETGEAVKLPGTDVTVYLVQTGGARPDNTTYLGTVLSIGGSVVEHVYYTY